MIALDVDDPSSVEQAVGVALADGGRLDAVVYCAGYGVAGPVEETADDEARAVFETNLLGALRICRAVLPTFRAQGTGTLVFVSSLAGRIGLPFQGLYSATKFALEGLAEALRMEVRPFGVQVVLVEPGDFRTAFTERRRRVRRSENAGPYTAAMNRVLAVAEADERAARTPEALGKRIARIVGRRSPRLRYTAGPWLQRLAAGLKRVLPGSVFERALRAVYPVDPPGVRRRR
jgi:NAD(P)-dependent dehydrogenase (short-subunit alcohol dehydrogenase family)